MLFPNISLCFVCIKEAVSSTKNAKTWVYISIRNNNHIVTIEVLFEKGKPITVDHKLVFLKKLRIFVFFSWVIMLKFKLARTLKHHKLFTITHYSNKHEPFS